MSRIPKPRLIFFGNERLATGVKTDAPTLRGLITRGYDIAAVVVNYTPAQSRSGSSRELEVVKVAQAHDIPVLSPKKLSDIEDQLRDLNPTAGVLLAYGRIIPQSIIDIFPQGIVNIHPSLLPLHRGSMPIEAVILEGATQTGVSLMQLAKDMDAGPVFAQSTIPLIGHETKQALYEQLLELGGAMLFECLPGILDGSLHAMAQDDRAATYDKLLNKNDGVVDWRKSAQQLEREIRAYLEWPKSRSQLAGKDVVITDATAIDITGTPGTVTVIDKKIVAHCGTGALQINKLKPAGKQEMTATAFINGYGKTLLTGNKVDRHNNDR